MRFSPIRVFIAALALALCLPFGALAMGENLLENGDFSQGDDGWRFDAWELDEGFSTIGVQGDAVYPNAVYVANHEENDARLCQDVSVEPGGYYRLSGYIKAKGCAGEWGASLALGDTYTHTGALHDTQGTWQYVEMTGQVAPGQKEVTVQLRVGGYGATTRGQAWFADVRLEKLDDAPQGAQVWAAISGGASATQAEDSGGKYTLLFVAIMAAFALAYAMATRNLRPGPLLADKKSYLAPLLVLGGMALLVRVALALIVYGYPNDIGCWLGWADQAVESNLIYIYRDASFLDYPPGYMYILYPLGLINRLITNPTVQVLVVKLPAIIADFLTAGLIYRIGAKKEKPVIGMVLGVLYLFNPLVIVDSAAWGQIDSIVALFTLLALWDMQEGHPLRACMFYGLGLAIKPQMLLLAPLMLYALIVEVRLAGGWKKALARAGAMLGVGALAVFVPALPFWLVSGKFSWLFGQYFGTMSSYNYGSVNASNFLALLGGNWRDAAEPALFGVSYTALGIAGIAVICAYILWRYAVRGRDHSRIFLFGALMLCGIYTFGQNMHERYMFPVVALLTAHFIVSDDKRSVWAALGLCAMQFMNVAIVLAERYITAPLGNIGPIYFASPQDGGAWLVVLSIAAVALCIWLVVIERRTPAARPRRIDRPEDAPAQKKPRLLRPLSPKPQWRKKDQLLMWGLTAVYAVVALVYLGDGSVPTQMWKGASSGDYVTIDLGEEQELSQMWLYHGLQKGDILAEYSPDGREFFHLWDRAYSSGSEFQIWEIAEVEGRARYVRLTVSKPTVRLNEVVFFGADGAQITPAGIASQQGEGGRHLIDEQHLTPERPSQMNSTYFDEIYHARTAWEHLENIRPYETTHPPLGKLIIAVGIAVFDMTPFGWRVMGAIFGVFMIPLVYWLGMNIFGRTRYAFIAAFLMAFDFMHFAQTRIATIDTYGVFFIIAMFGFMYKYVTQTNFNSQPLHKTLLPLGLCGLMFGLGAASKWICLYAGAGLTIIFFYSIFCRCREYYWACKGTLADGYEAAQSVRRSFWRNLVVTLAFCIVFFIAIPLAIYTLSYLPYLRATGADNLFRVMWDNQLSMFSYHSGLVDDHFFQSPWYQWPLIIKPIWFYKGDYLPQGMMGSIASFGNPAVWLPGTAALVYLAVRLFKKRRLEMPDIFILAGFLTQYLPWVMVPRSMFIYHYFASVPFFIMAIVLFISRWEHKMPQNRKWAHVLLIAVLALFILYYPVLSGLPIPSWWGKILAWPPTWYFAY